MLAHVGCLRVGNDIVSPPIVDPGVFGNRVAELISNHGFAVFLRPLWWVGGESAETNISNLPIVTIEWRDSETVVAQFPYGSDLDVFVDTFYGIGEDWATIILSDGVVEKTIHFTSVNPDPDLPDRSLVSVDELIQYLSGININVPQRDAAQHILNGTISALESYLNIKVTPELVTETVYCPTGLTFLRHSPVLEMVSMEPGGTAVLHPTLPALDFAQPGIVNITYWAGHSVDDSVKSAVLRVAAREFVARHDDTVALTSVRATTPQTPPASPIGWQKDELQALSRLRRWVVV